MLKARSSRPPSQSSFKENAIFRCRPIKSKRCFRVGKQLSHSCSIAALRFLANSTSALCISLTNIFDRPFAALIHSLTNVIISLGRINVRSNIQSKVFRCDTVSGKTSAKPMLSLVYCRLKSSINRFSTSDISSALSQKIFIK